ncbi:hypothetical protein [Salinimicrobium sp. GXAS 041]|uniref:hypothetical protein n=1 Tax=Salinimicrobium sp. GXAS 041 TaxID=3400806 RepID=UPI003C72C2BD
MKKIFSLLILSLFFACSENKNEKQNVDQTMKEETFTISKKTSENLKHRYLLTESIPTEGGPKITADAQHAAFSKIEYQQDGIFYVYQPEEGFTGTDEVEITHYISPGGPEMTATGVTKLQIVVSE